MGIRFRHYACLIIVSFCSTVLGGLIVPDNDYVGSKSTPTAIRISSTGVVTLLNNLAMGGNDITGVDDITMADDSVIKSALVSLTFDDTAQSLALTNSQDISVKLIMDGDEVKPGTFTYFSSGNGNLWWDKFFTVQRGFAVDNSAGVTAMITMDGTAGNPGSLTYNSDTGDFVLDSDLTIEADTVKLGQDASSAVSLTFVVTGDDGVLTYTAATDILDFNKALTVSGAIIGGSLSDGTATLTGGNLTVIGTIGASGDADLLSLASGILTVNGDIFLGANNAIVFAQASPTLQDRMFVSSVGFVIQENLSSFEIYCDTNDNNAGTDNMLFIAEGDDRAGGTATTIFSINKNGLMTIPGTAIIGDATAAALTIGAGAAGVDYALTVDGENNDGVITWMEDEDYFSVADDLFMNGETITDLGGLHFNSATELTISSGAVTVTQGHHNIDTEANAANDDLDTINGGNAGEILLLVPNDDAHTVRIRHGVGNIYLKHQTAEQSYNFNSPSGPGGTFYVAGFYDFPGTDANLDEGGINGTTITHGEANVSYAAHASLIAAGVGTATGGSGAVTIVVTGTSIDDEGNRDAGGSEVIVADITGMATDQYFETTLKWLGTVTYTLTVGATGHTLYAADFNYGFAKYEDLGNTNFSITLLECVGRAGANDTGFNIRLFYHNPADWTYAETGFIPGPTAGNASELANMNTDHSTEQNLVSGDPFAYKRTDLNQDIEGDNGEGIVIEITTSGGKAVEAMDVHIGVHSAPKFSYMATTKQHLIFMKHGPNWLEL